MSDDNTIEFRGATSVPLPVNKVLDGARDGNLVEVIVIGVGQDDQIHIYSTSGNLATMVGLLRIADNELLNA